MHFNVANRKIHFWASFVAGLPLLVVSDVHTSDFAEEDSLTRGSRFVETLRRHEVPVPEE